MAFLASQNFIEVEDIKENTLIMKNGTIRALVACSSINFALKSDDEQNAILYQFQNFLNSLDFPMQFVAQSRKINIEEYLKSLKKLEEQHDNELMKLQISEYQEFIKALVAGINIMSKNFFAVIPFAPFETKGGKGASSFAGGGKSFKLKDEDFQRGKSQLMQRVEFVGQGLRRCGIHSVVLGQKELIELFWARYNPKLAESGEIPKII